MSLWYTIKQVFNLVPQQMLISVFIQFIKKKKLDSRYKNKYKSSDSIKNRASFGIKHIHYSWISLRFFKRKQVFVAFFDVWEVPFYSNQENKDFFSP